MVDFRKILSFCLALVLAVPCVAGAAAPNKLAATSYGAAGQVSGSLHVLDTGNGRWMVDCGKVFERNKSSQGSTEGEPLDENPAEDIPQTLPAGLEKASAVFLTHAHADHLGRLPLLVNRGFTGPIYMTEATAAIAVPMLGVQIRLDRTTVRSWTWSKDYRARAETGRKSLFLHWRDCKYRKEIAPADVDEAECSLQELTDRFEKENSKIKTTPCKECVDEEVDSVLRLAKKVKYHVPFNAGEGVRATFFDAGHIPGSASVLLEVTLGGKQRRVLFSGDLGNGLSPLLATPKPAPKADVVFVETTYGTICRKPEVRQQREAFRRAVAESVERGGVTWIPCFSLDRTQKILYELRLAQREKLLPAKIPIYCPSPTAKEVTQLYREHLKSGWFEPEVAAKADAFSPREVLSTVPSADKLPRPCIIICTSDIVIAPWMRKLLSVLLPERTTSLVLVGYQFRGSAGELLLHGATKLDIDGQEVPCRAKVQAFSCFSGHADAADVDAWLVNIPKESTVVLVHGGVEELKTRAEQLQSRGYSRVIIAKEGERMELDSSKP